MNTRLHEDELEIDDALVRRLVDGEFPDYARLPLRRLAASGSTNALYRLGDALLVRLPRQPGGGAAIDKERRWLPTVGSQLSIQVPEVVGVGERTPDHHTPSHGERWSIVRWIDGELPEVCEPGEEPTTQRLALAEDLAAVILTLRGIEVPESAAADPSLRWYRGGSLAGFDETTRKNIQLCRSLEGLDLDLDAVLHIWNDALVLPGAADAGPDRWFHSDLVAENLLLSDGRLTAVLDFGGLAVGDPTVDLHGAWELFDDPAREAFRSRLQVDDAEWLRGRAWALAIALSALSYYWNTMPGRRRDRLAMVRSVLVDAGRA